MQRQRELFALLVGGRPDEIESRVAGFELLLSRFEDEHSEALASERPWKARALRPYLLCRGEYAKALWIVGRRDEALEEIGVLLELQPEDHLRLRGHLLVFLLAMEDWEGLRLELEQRGCANATLMALIPLAIEVGEDDEDAGRARIRDLLRSHPQALSLWLGRRHLPLELPLEAEPDSLEEAWLAVSLLRSAARPTLVDRLRDLLTRVAGSKAWNAGEVVARATPADVEEAVRGEAVEVGKDEAAADDAVPVPPEPTPAERLARILAEDPELEPDPLRHYVLATVARLVPGAAGARSRWPVEIRREVAAVLLEVAEADDRPERARILARLAVELDPLQLDAQLLVAELAGDDAARELYETRRALKVAEKAIPPTSFAALLGRFASEEPTRRYLEVLARLATLLAELDREAEAEEHRERIRRLDPSFKLS